VGAVIGDLAGTIIPEGSRIAAVIAYCGGMALFTIVMGNAFAAFPVMTAAIGLPLLVNHLGGEPARSCGDRHALGLLRHADDADGGELQSRARGVAATAGSRDALNGVIKAQIPTALPLLAVNTVLMYFLAFPVLTMRLTRPTSPCASPPSRSAHVSARISHKLDHVWLSDADATTPRAAASDLLRQLRLAFLRAWLLDARAAVCGAFRIRRRKARRCARSSTNGAFTDENVAAEVRLPRATVTRAASSGLMVGRGSSKLASRA
jgi:hypothetical protein